MCDTMIAMGSITATGRVLLAKNSDREPNEAQYLHQEPAADHAPGAVVQMTYVSIPQAAQTHALVGSRPWWMWGFEHGVNEHGLAIGNEAVWSRLPAGREEGLLGMDLLRLTLERAKTADEALMVLTTLLQEHGQSGRAARHLDMFYHNAFILADAGAAWVVETAGRHWVAKRVKDWAAISNVYSIGTDYDLISAEAESFAVSQGWHIAGRPFDWMAAFADTQFPEWPSCQARLDMARAGMGVTATKPVTLTDMFARLRDHGDTAPDWRPGEDAQSMICMHSHHIDHGSQTVASMVAELSDKAPLIWCSLGAPCLSAFIPVRIGDDLPVGWAQPAPGDPDAWWRMTELQRLVERDYAGTAPMVRAAFDAVEAGALSNPDAAHAAAQAGAVAALTATVAALQAGVLPPRGDDPRGTYLADAAAHAPDTALQKVA